MSDKIKLGAVTLDARDYASQGNALLGIRDSGKSYTATYLAEQLMLAGIPIIAFDPIGRWRFLRVAGKGAGFPARLAGAEQILHVALGDLEDEARPSLVGQDLEVAGVPAETVKEVQAVVDAVSQCGHVSSRPLSWQYPAAAIPGKRLA